ncbi:MAG: orotate phosphoribosyltransferase [Candidatus Eutrophobiaceae bacterium]
MREYQRQFIEFSMQSGALRFGNFRTKAGRETPWFFNSGEFCDGLSLMKLGESYAAALEGHRGEFDMLYGPAYKGIPLISTTAIALAHRFQVSVPWCFNRKESKDHGEGGSIVGSPLKGRVMIVEDVVSSGMTVSESCEFIRAHGATPVGVAISVDRQERGIESELSAVTEMEQKFGISVTSIVTVDDVMVFLERIPEKRGELQAIQEYQRVWGA